MVSGSWTRSGPSYTPSRPGRRGCSGSGGSGDRRPWSPSAGASSASAGTAPTPQTPLEAVTNSQKVHFIRQKNWKMQCNDNLWCYLVFEKNDELRAEDQATELGRLEDRKLCNQFIKLSPLFPEMKQIYKVKWSGGLNTVPRHPPWSARRPGSRCDWWTCCWGCPRWFPPSLFCSDTSLGNSSPLWVEKKKNTHVLNRLYFVEEEEP